MKYSRKTPVFLGEEYGTKKEGLQKLEWANEIAEDYKNLLKALKLKPGQDPIEKLNNLLAELESEKEKVRKLEKQNEFSTNQDSKSL